MFSSNRDTKVAICSTLFILFIFQLGAYITAPGITLADTSSVSGISQLLNMLGGGGLKKVSLLAIGVSPYITAQIIIQMLSNDVVRHLSELRKGGERGRHKMELYTRILTLPFAIMTALGTLVLVSSGKMASFKHFDGTVADSFSALPTQNKIFHVLLFVAGTYISLFLADIISKRGLGNGITLIIMSGIISSLPENFISTYKYLSSDRTVLPEHQQFMNIFKFIIYLFFYLLILLLIVFINGSVRKIPIQQTGQGLILDRRQLSYLPIKLMPAGIIPVVFAGSIMVIPSALGELVKGSSSSISDFAKNYFSLTNTTGLVIYSCLIILFSFLYSHVQINVEEITRGFSRGGNFIPGIRSGQHTFNYLKSVINRLNCFGAPFLAFISVLPNFLNIYAGLPNSMSLGGTGIVILVSGTIQILDSIKSNTITSRYKTKSLNLTQQIQRSLEFKDDVVDDGQIYLW